MDINKLLLQNPWWSTGEVNKNLVKDFKRKYFFRIKESLENNFILILYGLRRTGKTTLLFQTIDELIKKGIKSTDILYFSFDESSADFDDLIRTYESEIRKEKLGGRRVYIFLDEVQKLKDWENKVKLYYDLGLSIKFILSGSASLSISRKSKESLAGRAEYLLIEPLSFSEYLEWKHINYNKDRPELSIDILLPLFNDYLRKGGFPEIINETDENKVKEYIKNNITERIIGIDIPKEFGIRDYDLLHSLINIIANNPGMIINFDSLSKELGRSKISVIKYMYLLEYSLLIKTIRNFRKNFVSSSRKMKKAYLNNVGIAFALSYNQDKQFIEKIAENFAVLLTKAENYYRAKGYEIDIVLKDEAPLPIEVKYGNDTSSNILKFMEEYNINRGIVLTRDRFETIKENNRIVEYIPLCIYSLRS